MPDAEYTPEVPNMPSAQVPPQNCGQPNYKSLESTVTVRIPHTDPAIKSHDAGVNNA